MQFVVDIWSQAGNCMDFSTLFEEKVYIAVTHLYTLIILSIVKILYFLLYTCN